MTRLSAAFAKPHPSLVTFITAGDGETAANLDALVAGGADVIELGMPFTDPMADGPAIQAANLRSLAAGTTTADIFGIAAAFRARHADTPLVLMGYANPMTVRGARLVRLRMQQGRRRRRHLRRYPARRGCRARPAVTQRRHRPHPPRHPHHRHRAPARGARWRVGLSLLCQRRRDHRQATGGARPASKKPSPA